MEVRAMVAAVAFGLLMGWGLGRALDDIRPVTVALVTGIALGAVIRVFGAGAEAALAGGSLLLGCTAGLVGLVPGASNRATGRPKRRKEP